MQKETEVIVEITEKVTQESEAIIEKNGLGILFVTVGKGVEIYRIVQARDMLINRLGDKLNIIITQGNDFDMKWIVPQDFTFEELKAYLEQNK